MKHKQQIQLEANVAKVISFDPLPGWSFSGEPLCYVNGESIGYTISSKTSEGFTVTAPVACTFEYTIQELLRTPQGTIPKGNTERPYETQTLSLIAGISQLVTFRKLSLMASTQWVFVGKPDCYNLVNQPCGYEITLRTETGFTVTGNETSTFNFTAIQI